jgi:hypothetical protein
MTRYAPLWQQAGSYAASLDRSLLNTIWPAAGSSGGVVSAVANTMTVSVAPGTAVVALQAGQGSVLCRWDAAEVPPALAAAPPSGQSRIDLVVAQVRDNALDSGGNSDFVFQVVTGTAAASNPAVPAVPTNAYPMAQVLVPGAAANLNAATITDRRISSLTARDKLHARVYRAGAWTTGNYTGLGFDTVDYDPSGVWLAPNFVIPVAGIYSFVSLVSTATGTVPLINVAKNGAIAAYGYAGGGGNDMAGNVRALVVCSLKCASGDTVAVGHNATVAVAGSVGATATFFSIDYLGTG